jgi:hypothetical protein
MMEKMAIKTIVYVMCRNPFEAISGSAFTAGNVAVVEEVEPIVL